MQFIEDLKIEEPIRNIIVTNKNIRIYIRTILFAKSIRRTENESLTHYLQRSNRDNKNDLGDSLMNKLSQT